MAVESDFLFSQMSNLAEAHLASF